MKNSPRCLRIQVYFFKIHSKSDNFLPHSTTFYLYCCNKLLTSLFFSLLLPLYTLFFTKWTAWSFKNIRHITFLPYCEYSTSFPFTCNKTKASPSGLPSPVWSGPCLLLSDLVFFHTALFTGLQHHWFCGSPNTWASPYLRAGTLPLLSACSGLLLDICLAVFHHSGLSSCGLYRQGFPGHLPKITSPGPYFITLWKW